MVEGTAKPRELTEEERLLSMSDYLRRVGELSELVLAGAYDALVAYLHGRLH